MHASPNGINLPKHAPIVMTISDGLDQLIDKTAHRAPLSVPKVVWHKVNGAHVAPYKECLHDKLNNIHIKHISTKRGNVLWDKGPLYSQSDDYVSEAEVCATVTYGQ